MRDYLALNGWIERHRDTPFKIGEHDCLTFANGAARAFTGHGFADDWLARYTDRRGRMLAARALRSRFGHETVEDAMDARARRVGVPAPRGAIVVTEHAERVGPRVAFGVSLGHIIAAPGKSGVEFLPATAALAAWEID